MALRNKLLSRFLGRDKEKRQEAKQEDHNVQNGASNGEQWKNKLLIPEDHALSKLWSLYSGSKSALRLGFDIPDKLECREELEDLMTDEYLQLELRRMMRALTSVAERRLEEFSQDEDAEAPYLDAKVQLLMTSDKVTAWYFIYPPSGGGDTVNEELLQRVLDMSRVCFGVNRDLLYKASKLEYFKLYLAACGEPPVNGQDGEVIDFFPRNPICALPADESGKVDFSALQLFHNIKKDEAICRLTEPTPCEDGRTVTDEVCFAHVGKPASLPRGRNTVISEEGDRLLAMIDGHVEFSGRSFQVKPVLEIGGDVDFSTGNINCLGDIHIRGDISSGFTVRATGSITVDGVIEACTVEAGTDLVVKKGVQGNGKAILRAHRSIYAKYLESTTAYVGENIDTECIINCDVFSDGKVTVRSGRGTIIGGQVCAAFEISANIVGARSEAHTVVKLGGRPCEEFERENLAKEIMDYEKEIEKLKRQPESPSKSKQIAKMRVQISADKLKLQQFDKELEKLDEENNMVEYGKGRLVCNTIYPGTEINIGRAMLRVSHEDRMCTATIVGGEVVLS